MILNLDCNNNPDRCKGVRLAKKTALITGGNSATGLAAARLFLAEGARVAITGRNHERLDAATSELGSGLVSIQADVTDIETTKRAVAKTVGGDRVVEFF